MSLSLLSGTGHATDYDSLSAYYTAFGSYKGQFYPSWSFTSSSVAYCGWSQVNCANGILVGLTLAVPAYVGQTTGPTIPNEISMFLGLTKLDMSSGYFAGSLPTTLFGMTNLKYLSARNSQLSGSILPAFTALTRLTFLDLGNSSLSGGIPPQLSMMTNLVALYLDGNGQAAGLTGECEHIKA